MFTEKLLLWYDENQRSLPWRGEKDPYKIWVSEIILQQTRVQQGWDYYLRFIQRFPNVQALANAEEEQVLLVWQGLGYYSRARNMHFAAKQIMTDYQGIFPNDYDSIRKLKGIGDYTAAAISSIAFGLPYAAIDGNVLRIISRIFGVCEDISILDTKKRITDLCNAHIDKKNPGVFNQACMDFGALWCTPKGPKCHICPFSAECYASKHNMTETLPIKSNKIVKKERFFHFIFFIYSNSIILEKRTGKDIWKNLYQFPLTERKSADTLKGLKKVAEFREVLTHQIVYGIFYMREAKRKPICKENQELVAMENIKQYPMPKIMLDFLKSINMDIEDA